MKVGFLPVLQTFHLREGLLHAAQGRLIQHEIKAFFEYLIETSTKVLTIGIYGAFPDRTDAVSMDGSGLLENFAYQSAAFVIAETNGKPKYLCWRKSSCRLCAA